MPGVRAWSPGVPGITEVFHARFTDHAYPAHAHDTWTVLVVDEGVIRYDLDRHEHGALGRSVTVLPPHVAHTGRSATHHGFRKRVLYVDTDVLGATLTGAALATPTLDDDLLRTRVAQLHTTLDEPGSAFEAEGRLALIGDRIRAHLGAAGPAPAPSGWPPTCATCSTTTSPPGSPCARHRGCCTPPRHIWCGRSQPRSGCPRTAT